MSIDVKFKQVLAVRVDLEMGKGKIAVQCAHAAVSASENARKQFPDWWSMWVRNGQAKIVVKVRGLEALLELERVSTRDKVPFFVVRDRGLTQLEPGTVTCIGIGPCPVERIDLITGSLPLL